MTQSNWPRSLAAVLANEGGFSLLREDPGNWTGGKVGVGELKGTNKGISAAAYPHLDIKNLTDAQIADIYVSKYWRPVRGNELPDGVDFSALDFAVHSGVSRSARYLQRVLGVTADGVVGPVTVLAAKAADARKVIKAHCGARLGFLQSINIWKTFAKGLGSRVAKAEATALSMVSSKSQLEQDAASARNKAATQAGGAVVGVGGGVGVDQAPDVSGLPVWAIVIVVGVIVVPLIIRAAINAQRAAAISAAAKAA